MKLGGKKVKSKAYDPWRILTGTQVVDCMIIFIHINNIPDLFPQGSAIFAFSNTIDICTASRILSKESAKDRQSHRNSRPRIWHKIAFINQATIITYKHRV